MALSGQAHTPTPSTGQPHSSAKGLMQSRPTNRPILTFSGSYTSGALGFKLQSVFRIKSAASAAPHPLGRIWQYLLDAIPTHFGDPAQAELEFWHDVGFGSCNRIFRYFACASQHEMQICLEYGFSPDNIFKSFNLSSSYLAW